MWHQLILKTPIMENVYEVITHTKGKNTLTKNILIAKNDEEAKTIAGVCKTVELISIRTVNPLDVLKELTNK